MVREKLAILFYIGVVEYLAVFLIWSPADALIQSSTGWAQIASSSAISSYTAANRSALISQVAASAMEASAASVAARIVAGSAFGIVGVLAGLALYHIYYSQQDMAAVKQAATPPISVPGYSGSAPIISKGTCGANQEMQCIAPAVEGSDYVWVDNGYPYTGMHLACQFTGQFFALGWSTFYRADNHEGCLAFNWGGASTAPTGGDLSQTTIANYLSGLPPSDPHSIEAHSQPLGQGATIPAADAVSITSVSPSQLPATTVPAGNVTSGDAVLNPNASPPTNTTTNTTTTQTTTNTTTTTTTTNQDGSTTTQEAQQETGTVSCTSGTHDQRTLGTILQDHINKWNSSGLVGALNTLKTLVWPSTFPTYTLNSSIFGTMTFNFSGYAWAFTALRSLIIAVASFVAYRIVFVGNA